MGFKCNITNMTLKISIVQCNTFDIDIIFIFILYKWKMKSLCRFAANRSSGTLTPLSRQTICHYHISLIFNFIWTTSHHLTYNSHNSVAVPNLFIFYLCGPPHFFSNPSSPGSLSKVHTNYT